MRAWMCIIPVFFITEPEHLQILLATHKYSTKNWFYGLLHNFLGNGLITNSGTCIKLEKLIIKKVLQAKNGSYIGS